MGFISHFLAGGLFNRSEMNKKLDEINDALSPSWKLIDKIDNTVGYSGEWTAPDVFGDGSPYDLGVYMIGGGGSGATCCSSTGYGKASGGASGYGKNIIIRAKPGDVFPYVIGLAGALVTSLNGKGNNGGSTSFAENIADGGEGGKTTNDQYGVAKGAAGGQSSDNSPSSSSYRLYGCVRPSASQDNRGSLHNATESQPPKEGQNQFDPHMITLCAGGAATSNGLKQTICAMPDGTKGGDGANASSGTVIGQSATGHGNGGGAAGGSGSSDTIKGIQSGAGSDGVIFLYARKAVVE